MRCALCSIKLTQAREGQIKIGGPVSCEEHESILLGIFAGKDVTVQAYEAGQKRKATISAEEAQEQLGRIDQYAAETERDLAATDRIKRPAIHLHLTLTLAAVAAYKLGFQ